MKKLLILLAVILVIAMTSIVMASAAPLPFDDVAADAWYYDTVVEAYETGVMKGQSETKFAPLKTMSRSEFVMLLYRITGVTETGFAKQLEKFDDGDTDEWYSEAMGWGVKRGLIKGMDDNTVRPAQTITRAELAVMIVRYLDYRGITLPGTAEETVFTDDAAIADWAREQIYTCQIWGIFKGDDGGNFNPANKATRAEGATIILRLTKSADDALKTLGVTVAVNGERSPYTVFYSFIGVNNTEELKLVKRRLDAEFDMEIPEKPYVASNLAASTSRIVFNVPTDPVIAEMTEGLSDSGYAARLVRDGEYTTLYFAYTSPFAGNYGLEMLLAKHVKDGVLSVPSDLDVTVKSITPNDYLNVIDEIDQNTRDPFIYVENGTYYMYVTGWKAYKSTSLTGEWTQIAGVVEKPQDYKESPWAPEVYKYNGKYYMFTTYTPKDDMNDYDNRGCIIMEADSPEGPFRMITDGWITPQEYDCIDATLYVDADGQPWMIYAREYTAYDMNGAFYAAKLSDDFTHFISEPVELFRGLDAWWASGGIAEGCFMYTTAEGELLMLWSKNNEDGYCLAVSRSKSGKLDGEWTHDDLWLFDGGVIGFDGGHGMIFEDTDGQLYAVVHSPNDWGGDSSRATVFPITERNGILIWDVTAD
ncbi:MAG: family 43 glycosylhydrolase [Clostridia bacterium]|nr:family 43 glycosylhydrolase [Clostridia bacterium]